LRHTILFLLLLLSSPSLLAKDEVVEVSTIVIEGNHKTKPSILLREMDFGIGDTIHIQNIQKRFDANKLNILNTGLFTEVQLNIKNWDEVNQRVNIVISVKENWYIYPLFLVELADRNFNVWWQEQNRDLNRINFGLDLYHTNFTGNKDRLKLGVLFGYSQKYELEYQIPYLNKRQTLGLIFDAYYSRRKEIAYQTIGNKLAFDRAEDQFQLYRYKAGITIQYRKEIRSYHNFRLAYRQNQISERVATELNPSYLKNGNTEQRVPAIHYEYLYDARDVRPYPMRGNYLWGTIVKEGLGIFNDRNSLFVAARYQQLIPISRKSSFDILVSAKREFIRKEQAYADYQALGYERDFMRGYELYVIDGIDFAYTQLTLKYELFNFNFNWGIFMPIRQLKTMPVRIMLTYNNDIGYVNSPQFASQNTLANTLLWGTGAGIDFIVYYDKIVQVQLSRNHLGEYGLFLHNKIFL
jgi:outer membrane protein assembly factor BamA